MNTNTFVVEFDLTADQINDLDATPITLATIGTSDAALVRVPVRAEIWRDSGTAYTVTHVPSVWDSDSSSTDDFDTKFAIERTLFPDNALWIRAADSRGQRGKLLFNVPIAILENTLKSGMVVMPEAGQSFVGGQLKLTIEAGTAIADGTGVLHGRLYFEEYALPI
jgi:hypothetical protein